MNADSDVACARTCDSERIPDATGLAQTNDSLVAVDS